MAERLQNNDYNKLLGDIKRRIRSAQYDALKAVNKELISLYWDIGRMITKKQEGRTWGKSIVEQLSKDLQTDFPGIKGFSERNMWRMRDFYLTYQKLPPLVAEIGWTHNILIMERCKDNLKREFYIRTDDENPSIGIILCKSKDKTIVEYALKESNRPIGIAGYKIVKSLPDELKDKFPEPENIARLLEDIR